MNIPEALRHYLVDFLEKPHPAFGALPPCPFARKERLAERVDARPWALSLHTDHSALIEYIRKFDANPQYSTLLIYDEHCALCHQDTDTLASQLMCALKDIEMLIIPLHPEAPFAPAQVYTRKAPFPTLVIQRHSLLSDAQVSLLKTTYYDNISEYDERMVLITNHQCTSEGIFFPAYWWTDASIQHYADTGQWPEEIIGETIQIQTSNSLHLWMHQYGEQFGWVFFGHFDSLFEVQQRIRLGGIFLATAHNSQSHGYVERLTQDRPRKMFPHYLESNNAIWQYVAD